MTSILKTAIVALALIGGAASANADTFTVHGYLGTAYGSN